MSSIKIVKLKRLHNGAIHDFDFDHALRLLRISDGWELSEKDWVFVDNEIVKVPKVQKPKK